MAIGFPQLPLRLRGGPGRGRIQVGCHAGCPERACPAGVEFTENRIASFRPLDAKVELLSLMLQHRFSTMPTAVTEQLDRLSPEQMDELGVALLDFRSPRRSVATGADITPSARSLTDLEDWLRSR
ncbi:MAG: DUF4351 domain-containing protein [Capsulimonadaceae bacterium]